MAERVKKRTSKWDMMAETHGPTEIRQDNALLVIADDSSKEQESNLNCISSQSKCSDMRTDGNMLYKDDPEADQSSRWAGVEEGAVGISNDCTGRIQSPKCSDMEAGVGDGFKRSGWESISGNQTTANDGTVAQSPKRSDVDAGDKDGSKWSQWETLSGNQGSAIDSSATDGWGTALNKNYSASTSTGIDAWRHGSRSLSPRNGWSRSQRSWSRSRDRGRSRSRSRSSRSRSRSPSPSHGLKHGSERWVERGRMGAGGSAAPCRDFVAGQCRRGSQCRYLHEDGGQRHFDNISRYGRGRYSGRDNKENFSESWEHRDYSRDRHSQRHGSNCDADWDKSEPHRNNRSTERCYDFTKGKCYRGSSCRYVHHDASSDGGGWHTKAEARERTHDRRDADACFGRGLETRRVSNVACKYFAEGRCRNGERCKFSHQGVPSGHSDGKPHDHKWDYRVETDFNPSRTSMDCGDKTVAVDAIVSPQLADQNNVRVVVAQPMRREDMEHKLTHSQSHNSQDNRYQMLAQDAPKKALPSQEQNIMREASGQYRHVPTGTTQVMSENTNIQHNIGIKESETVVVDDARSQAGVNSTKNLLTLATVPGQNFVQSGQSQCAVPQPLQVQSFTPNVQVQQAMPPLPFNGQMQQAYSLPSNGQSQFIPQARPNVQNFNLSLPSQPVLPSNNVQSQPNFNLIGQIQQNLPAHNGPNQQNFNLSGQLQSLPPPHNAQSQPNFHLIGQIQQGFPFPHNRQNLQNINISGQSQQSLLPSPQIGQTQQIAHSVAPNGQNPYAGLQPAPNPQSFNSGLQSNQMIPQHQANSNLPTQVGGEESTQKPGMSEILSSATPINHKVVTSEQAAQITNLSASLAQFFGNGQQLPQLSAALNPQSTTGQAPLQPIFIPDALKPTAPATLPFLQPGQGSLTQQQPEPITDSMDPAKSDTSNIPPGFSSVYFEQKDTKLEESETKLKISAPSSATGETNDGNQRNLEPKQVEVELSSSTASKEVNNEETNQSKKEQTVHPEDVNADVRTDGESKKSKDGKGIRMFKCALVEFVKDALKPAWKEGHLSKEVHKTIVKKVVDKVTGAMQSSNIPQTQDKIDLYMAYSKAKLNKLVQAYLEKYV